MRFCVPNLSRIQPTSSCLHVYLDWRENDDTQVKPSSVKEPQCFPLMHCDVIRLIALDLILRSIRGRVMDVALVVHVPCMHPHDMAADPTSLGIPGYMIADLECLGHELMILHLDR